MDEIKLTLKEVTTMSDATIAMLTLTAIKALIDFLIKLFK